MLTVAIIFVFLAMLFTYATIVWAFVTLKAWAWFIAAPFAFAPITFVQALAISTIISVLAARFVPHNTSTNLFSNDEIEKSKAFHSLYTAIVLPWVILLFMWIIHLFIG